MKPGRPAARRRVRAPGWSVSFVRSLPCFGLWRKSPEFCMAKFGAVIREWVLEEGGYFLAAADRTFQRGRVGAVDKIAGCPEPDSDARRRTFQAGRAAKSSSL